MKVCPECKRKHICRIDDSDRLLDNSSLPPLDYPEKRKSKLLPVIITAGIILAILFVIFTVGSGSAVNPHIIPDKTIPSEYLFKIGQIKTPLMSFWTIPPTITFSTDRRIYQGAKNAESHPASTLQHTPEYKIKMIFDKEQAPTIETIVREIKSVMLTKDYGVNGFIDLSTGYVQNLGTKDYESTYLQYPLITAFDSRGTEEEKAMLLAAILAYGGYDTALLSFPHAADHQAVGIKSNQPQKYPLTDGYAVIETGNFWEIGKTYMTTKATVSKVGSGTKQYYEGIVITP